MDPLRSAVISVLLLGVVAIPASATTIIVSNISDSGPGSLRQALLSANDGDTIDATGVSGVVTLGGGELLVQKSVTIKGAGADVLAVDGNAVSRVFHIDSGKTVSVSGLTITNGHDDTLGGGIENEPGSTLTISNSILSGNTAGSVGNPAVQGGGIRNLGNLTIVNTAVTANAAGGISGAGGGIYNGGTVTILNSTISANTASTGGGLNNGSSVGIVATISNSTFSGNSALAYGGACFNGGTLHMTNSTLSGNSASTGGGILVFGPLEIGDTILDKGDTGATIDSFGTVTVISLGYNLSSDAASGHLTGPGDQINTDPMLGPLQDNGGPTFTHALLRRSPAINAGDPGFVPPPSTDQRGRGFRRVRNSRVDIGSYEVQGHVQPLSH